MKHRVMAAGAALIVSSFATTVIVGASDSVVGSASAKNGASPYAIGSWGDLPYSPLQEQAGVPNLIADMNAQNLAFTVHDGDLKRGTNSPCDANLYERSLGYFTALKKPAMFTPGDNDWTDCDRVNNGGFSSRERLEYERTVFFSTPRSIGERTMRQDVQTEPLCLDAAGVLVG